MDTQVAVLDVGKTNLKLATFDAGGAQTGVTGRPTPWRDGPPYRHADNDAIWAWALQALRNAGRTGDGVRIADLVVTTHGAAAALVDERGLVLPVMDYEDEALELDRAAYGALRPPFTETCSPELPRGLNLGRQLFHLETRHEEAFRRARWILPYPQYWTWRLCGVPATEVTSLGCHTDLWDPRKGAPSSLVRARGWDSGLPPLRRAWDVAGTLSPEIAAATGLDSGTRVRIGIHDSNAALLPHLLADPDGAVAVVSTGTWFVLLAVGAPLDGLDPGSDMLANVAATGQPVATARFMGGREHEAILAGHADLADEADLAAILDSGALALPAFASQGGPFPTRTGRIEGELPARPGARAALATLYTALMTDLLLDRLAVAGTQDRGARVVIEGNAATDPLFARVLAGLDPGRTVTTATGSGGTAAGAALLARWGSEAAPEAGRGAEAPATRAVPLPPPIAAALARHRQRFRARLDADEVRPARAVR